MITGEKFSKRRPIQKRQKRTKFHLVKKQHPSNERIEQNMFALAVPVLAFLQCDKESA
jgi:hypothetical protein